MVRFGIRKSVAKYLVVVAVLAVFAVSYVVAQTVPEPPTSITVGTTGGRSETSQGFQVPAQAGNVSALVVSDTGKPEFWQGYFGNVTGTIALQDVNNMTLFQWELPNPAGEIYAVNTTSVVNWNNVTCVNFTGNASGDALGSRNMINLSNLAVQYNMNTTVTLENLSKEGLNYTFNTTFSGTFLTGTKATVTSDNCPQVTTFVDNAYQTSTFKEVLMHDNQSALIFVGLLELNKNGYQTGSNDLSDFQMLVAEDGSAGHEAASTYYFYVELS